MNINKLHEIRTYLAEYRFTEYYVNANYSSAMYTNCDSKYEDIACHVQIHEHDIDFELTYTPRNTLFQLTTTKWGLLLNRNNFEEILNKFNDVCMQLKRGGY